MGRADAPAQGYNPLYVAQGGDVGALVTDLMGRQGVEGLVGYHLNLLTAVLAIGDHLPREIGRGTRRGLQRSRRSSRTASATSWKIAADATPQTISYALLDSPIALAAWWPDHDTDSYYKYSRAFVYCMPVGNLTRDNILDNITLYWLTGTASSAARVVLGGRPSPGRGARERPGPAAGRGAGRLHDVPRRELGVAPELGGGRLPGPRLLQRGRPGGHFAAWEEPELFSAEVRAAFSALR